MGSQGQDGLTHRLLSFRPLLCTGRLPSASHTREGFNFALASLWTSKLRGLFSARHCLLPAQALSAPQGCLFPSFPEEMLTSVPLKSQSSVKVTCL